MSSQDKFQRSILPIPDSQHVGLTTYDPKDPDTGFRRSMHLGKDRMISPEERLHGRSRDLREKSEEGEKKG